MKLIKTASGKKTLKMSKSEWERIGQESNWDEQNIETTIKGTPNRGDNLNNIADWIQANYDREANNTLWGYAEQIGIVAEEFREMEQNLSEAKRKLRFLERLTGKKAPSGNTGPY